MSSSLTTQLRSVYLYTFFSGMMFWYGIEQLFLEEIGDGVFARGAVLAAFSFTMFLVTIPAGALADVWGRVRSLKFGIAMMIVSLFIFGFSNSVAMYALGAVFFALFWSFDEGSKEAYVYDLLVDENQEKDYQKILGRIYASLLLGTAVANFSSGFLADVTSLRTTYWISLVSCVFAVFYLLRLREPDHHKQEGKKILAQLDDAGRALVKSRVLIVLVVSMTLLYLILDIAGEFAQPAIVEHTDSAVLNGVAWGVMSLIMAVANVWAYKVRGIFGFMVVTFFMLVAYFVYQDGWGSVLLLFLFVAMSDAISIRGEAALQENTKSHLRATMASIPGSVSTLTIALVGLWVGGAQGSVAPRIFAVAAPSFILVFLLWLTIRKNIPDEVED